MSTGAIIAIVVGVIVIAAILVLVSRAMRARQHERRRTEAGELRQEAQSRGLRAERESSLAAEQEARAKRAQAEAEEKAAAARREAASAEERSREAERHRRFARERAERANEVDPDVDEQQMPAGTGRRDDERRQV